MTAMTEADREHVRATLDGWAAAGPVVLDAVTRVAVETGVPRAHAMLILADVILNCFATLDRDRALGVTDAIVRQIRAAPHDIPAYRAAQSDKMAAVGELQRLMVLASIDAAGPGN